MMVHQFSIFMEILKVPSVEPALLPKTFENNFPDTLTMMGFLQTFWHFNMDSWNDTWWSLNGCFFSYKSFEHLFICFKAIFISPYANCLYLSLIFLLCCLSYYFEVALLNMTQEKLLSSVPNMYWSLPCAKMIKIVIYFFLWLCFHSLHLNIWSIQNPFWCKKWGRD